MPLFWGKSKKNEKEHRAHAQSLLERTKAVIGDCAADKAPGPPSSSRDRRSSSPQPPPSYSSLYPWSTQLLRRLADTKTLPFPRVGHAVAPYTVEGDIYLFGGRVPPESLSNDLYVITTSGPAPAVKLCHTSGDVPSCRVGHGIALMGNHLIVYGGDTNMTPEFPFNANRDSGLYFLDIKTKNWTCILTPGPRPGHRYGHAAVALGSRFILFGGQNENTFLSDLWSIDIDFASSSDKLAWVMVKPYGRDAPGRRAGHVLLEYQGQLLLFGGTDGIYHYNDVWLFNLETQRWSELRCTGIIPAPRKGHAGTIVNGVLYVFGGKGTSGRELDDLAAFVISDRRWVAFQDMGSAAPSRRAGHKMVSAGANIYILGGEASEPNSSNRVADHNFVHVLDTGVLVTEAF